MKIAKSLCVSLFFLLLVINASAQVIESTTIQSQIKTISRSTNSIEFNGSSDTREIEVEVAEEGSYFSLDINGEIQAGSLRIEVYDPKEKKRATFSTGSLTEDKPERITKKTKQADYIERVNGQIRQQNAMAGIWIVKIIPNEAQGRFMIRRQSESNQKTDN